MTYTKINFKKKILPLKIFELCNYGMKGEDVSVPLKTINKYS